MSTVYLFCFVAAVAANPVFQRIQLCPSCPSQTCPSAFPAACPAQTCSPQAIPAQTCSSQSLPVSCQTCQNNQVQNNQLHNNQFQNNQLQSNQLQNNQLQNNQFQNNQLQSNQLQNNQLQNNQLQNNQLQNNQLQNNQLQNNHLQNNLLQNLLSTIPVVVRPSNSCPCNNCAAQNQVINQPLNQEALGQLVLSQILAPHVQKLLTPNGKRCYQCETQKAGVPNVINNYIIIPPEYYKANGTNAKNGDKVIQGADVAGNRQQKINRQTGKSERDKTLQDLIVELLKTHQNEDDTENSVGRRKQSGKRGTQRNKDNLNCLCKEEESTTCPCDEKGEENIDINGGDLKRAKILQDFNRYVEDNNQMKIINSKRKYPEYLKSLEEAIVKDFRIKNPTIPEDVARSLLENVIRQIKNQEISYNNHSSNSLIGYNNQYQQLNNNDQQINKIPPEREQSKSGRRQQRPQKNRSDRRNQKQNANTESSKVCDNCNKTVELNPTVLNIEKETITTEKITKTTENFPKTGSESQIQSKKVLVDKLDEIKDKFAKLNEVETTTASYNRLIESFPELGKEDKVPTFYENGVEDFYPDFRGDDPFYESGEELNRYHYTTDRNGMAEGKRYVNLKKHKSYLSGTNPEYTLPVEEDSLEAIDNKNYGVQFRSPPLLELPDFKTKQINKYCNSEEINDFVPDDSDKASVYSNSKTNFRVLENDLRPMKVFSKDKKGRTSIETVLGHSKVVRYGQDNRDLQDAGSTPAITYYLPEEAMTEDRIQLPDGDGIVVAKSIRDLEQIWV